MLTNTEMLIMHLIYSTEGGWRDKDAIGSLSRTAKLNRESARYQVYRLAQQGYINHNGRRGAGNKATLVCATTTGRAAYEKNLGNDWQPPPWLVWESLHWVKAEILYHLGIDPRRGWRHPKDAIQALADELGISRRTVMLHFNQLEAKSLVKHNGKTIKGGVPTAIFATKNGLAICNKQNKWPHLTRKKNLKRKSVTGKDLPGEQTKDNFKDGSENPLSLDGIEKSEASASEIIGSTEVTGTITEIAQPDKLLIDTDPPTEISDFGDLGEDNQETDDSELSSLGLIRPLDQRLQLLVELLEMYSGKWVTPNIPALTTAAEALGMDSTALLPVVQKALAEGRIHDNSQKNLRPTAYWLTDCQPDNLPPPIPFGHKAPKPQKLKEQPAKVTASLPLHSPTHDDMSNVGRVMWSLWIIGAGATLSTLIALVNNRKPSLSPGEIEEALNTLVGSSRATKHIAPDSKYIYWNPVR